MTNARTRIFRRGPIAAALLIGLAGAGAAWFGANRDAAVSVAPECRAAQAVAGRLAPLARGEVAALTTASAPKPVPALAFNGPDGRPLALTDLKGKTLLVNLWATWCVPCRQEMPALDRLQAEFGGPDFEVVAVNVDTRNIEKPKAWLDENGIRRLGFYADPQGKVLQVLQRSGHVVGLPTTLLVDPAGCEIAVLRGPAEWAGADAFRLVGAALGRPST